MLPEFQRLQQQIDELKATLKDKEAINQVSKNDLVRLNKRVMELGLQVNTANQRAEHEANKFKSLQAEKEKMDQKLIEVAAEVKASKEQTVKAQEEARKTELENKALKEKIAQLESGSTLNQNIMDAVMQKFVSSETWKDAQVDNFISLGKIPFIADLSSSFYFIINFIINIIFLMQPLKPETRLGRSTLN